MTITYKDMTGRIICTQTDKIMADHNRILHEFLEKEEILLENSFYQIKGLLVRPPMDSPPEIHVKAQFLRSNYTNQDYDD